MPTTLNVPTSLLSVPQAIEQRHAIRKYLPEAIPEADLREILRLTGLAPSAFNIQPWRFVVVREPQLKLRLQAASYNQAQVGAAPAVIVLYTDMADAIAHLDDVIPDFIPAERRAGMKANILGRWGEGQAAEREAFGAQQGYIALGVMLLAAQSMGYATSPMSGFDPAQIKEVLGLPEHVAIPAIIPIGRPDEAGHPRHRLSAPSLVTFR